MSERMGLGRLCLFESTFGCCRRSLSSHLLNRTLSFVLIRSKGKRIKEGEEEEEGQVRVEEDNPH